MIQNFFDSLEDPKRPFLGPNVWLFNKIGVILPNNPINKTFYFIIHEFVTVFVITQFIELYMIRSDLDLVITNLKISIVSFICIVKVKTFIFWQTSWKEVIEYITEADNNERENSDNTTRQIINSYTRYGSRLVKFFWILLLITFICVAGTPLFKYLSSSNYREDIKNGTEPFPHIFSSWVPFDKNISPGCWITVCLQIICCAYGAVVQAAYDSFVMVAMVFFDGKLQLLHEKCKNMCGCNGLGVTHDQFKITLRNLHTEHIRLLKHSKLFDSLLSPVMFLYVVVCSLMICACAFQLTLVTSTMQQLLIAQYLVVDIACIFMFCWHSNKVLDQSQRVIMGPYESDWWAMDTEQRKSVLILTEQLKLFPVFSAGPFTKLTLSTFVSILKGAYSYYALLRN